MEHGFYEPMFLPMKRTISERMNFVNDNFMNKVFFYMNKITIFFFSLDYFPERSYIPEIKFSLSSGVKDVSAEVFGYHVKSQTDESVSSAAAKRRVHVVASSGYKESSSG